MQINKKISKFLVGEESKIPKKALVGMGAALLVVGISAAAALHSSNTTLQYLKPNIRAVHSSQISETTTMPTTTTVYGSTTSSTTTTSY